MPTPCTRRADGPRPSALPRGRAMHASPARLPAALLACWFPVLRPAPRRPRACRVEHRSLPQSAPMISRIPPSPARRLPARGADAQVGDKRSISAFSTSPSTTSRWAAPRSTRRFLRGSDSLRSPATSDTVATLPPPDALRRAGDAKHHLPRGLLTRAWCSFAEASFFAKATKDESAHSWVATATTAALFPRAGRFGRSVGNRRARPYETLPGRHPPLQSEAVWKSELGSRK